MKKEPVKSMTIVTHAILLAKFDDARFIMNDTLFNGNCNKHESYESPGYTITIFIFSEDNQFSTYSLWVPEYQQNNDR